MNIPYLPDSGINYSWLPLDNAAKIFPAVQSPEHTTVFRISVILLERVKIAGLLQAIRKIQDFPILKNIPVLSISCGYSTFIQMYHFGNNLSFSRNDLWRVLV